MKRIPKIYLETTVFNYFFDRDRTLQITGMINSRYNLQNAVIAIPGDILT